MNLPNKLTVLRIIMIPFMMFFYLADFIPYGIGKIVALALFILASFTDLLDGKIARKHNLITNLGKFLDPIADKMLTSAVLFMIIADGTIVNPLGAIVVTIIISREFMVSALRFMAASKGVVVAADMWGKVKTVVQMISLPFCIVLAFLYSLIKSGIAVVGWLVLIIEIISYASLILATMLTVISGINYIIKNKECFKEN